MPRSDPLQLSGSSADVGDAAIRLERINKRFGGMTAVEDLDLVVPRGGCADSSVRTAPARRRRSE